MDLLIIAITLFLAYVFGELFFRLQYPRVLGQLVAGFLIGIPFIKKLLFANGTPATFNVLSELGIIFLLLLAGMEVNYWRLSKTKKESLLVAIFSALVPALLGFGLMVVLGYSYLTAFIVGGALAVTAEGITIKILMDLKKLNTKLGSIMVGASILDNILELFILSIILIFVHNDVFALALFPIKISLFAVMTYLLFKIVPAILHALDNEPSEMRALSTAIIVGLFIASITSFLGFGTIIGAFIGGMLLKFSVKKRAEEKKLLKNTRLIAFSFVVPFFFVSVGLNFDFGAIVASPLLFFLITVVAIVGKIGGVFLVKPFTKLSFDQLHFLGWGLNARGAVELIIAQIALTNNLIDVQVYSAIVFMAILTTLLFPLMVKHFIKKKPQLLH
ncbi:cation:proton antiporter [Candidatus Woesearchaeota archaeon]|nr:cation:proton antiporter [Candidatus Woesearchaeota archaeon]